MMSENIEIQTILAQKTHLNTVSDSPVTDPASNAKVCHIIIFNFILIFFIFLKTTHVGDLSLKLIEFTLYLVD